jgi:pyruvate formate lyase activating enzyme
MKVSRREFFKYAGVCAFGVCLGKTLGFSHARDWGLFRPGSVYASSEGPLKEVTYYKCLKNKIIECTICPKLCRIGDKERGFCGNKENRGGRYYSLAYSQVCALHVDPIEKKPFFHFLPAARTLSLSTAGCNFTCKYCQNWEISQFRPEQLDNRYITPNQVIELARKTRSQVIAFTYGEPVVFYDYMLDIARLAKKAGVKSVMISNGYIEPGPLEVLCDVLDAVKIDLKGFRDKFYREVCSGTLRPVLDAIKVLRRVGIWFEIVYLVVPTLNDTRSELRDVCSWVKEELGPDVPLHFSRFYPHYLLKSLPPTPVKTLVEARDIGLSLGLQYVYIGNVPGHEGEHTYCPKDGKVLIKRAGYMILENNLAGGKCKFCGTDIPGVW